MNSSSDNLLLTPRPSTSGLTAPPTPTGYGMTAPNSANSTLQAPNPKLTSDMAEMGREMGRGKQTRRRLVLKSGECNVSFRHVTKRKRSYLVDLFTTLVDMKWRFHVVFFTSGFLVSWCSFAVVWYVIAYLHGDTVLSEYENTTSCIDGVHSYHTALLYSIETQHTIGYGTRAINDECWYAAGVLMVQSCVGVFIQALITGIIFAKMSRPKGRAQTLLFSEKAVICKRDFEYFLLFRIGDMRRSHIIGTSIRAQLVKNRLTAEGESIPLCQYPIDLESETSHSDPFAFLVWPVTVVHKIDDKSPLWELSAQSLYHEYFEIIVILEGTIESTGSLTQFRTSYLPSEIRWGERLAPLLTYQRHNGKYQIDFEQFHGTVPMTNMQTCSAKEYHDMIASLGDTGRSALLEKDYPVSYTAPAIRSRSAPSLRKYGLGNIFHRKSKQNDDDDDIQLQQQLLILQQHQQARSQSPRSFAAAERSSLRNSPSAMMWNGSETGSTTSTMVQRKPGSKRPLWRDNQRKLSGVRSSDASPKRLYLASGSVLEEGSSISLPFPDGIVEDLGLGSDDGADLAVAQKGELQNKLQQQQQQQIEKQQQEQRQNRQLHLNDESRVNEDKSALNSQEKPSSNVLKKSENFCNESENSTENQNQDYASVVKDKKLSLDRGANVTKTRPTVTRSNSRFKVTTSTDPLPRSPTQPEVKQEWGHENKGYENDKIEETKNNARLLTPEQLKETKTFARPPDYDQATSQF